jgi:hypothetical protein
MALELRGVRLRRPLDRKKVEGCARDAMRKMDVDDIGKGGCCEGLLEIFGELLRTIFKGEVVAGASIGFGVT